MPSIEKPNDEQSILLGEGLAPLPKKLLDSHASGKVMFLVGAGVSQNSGLVDFKRLVLEVYRTFDRKIYDILTKNNLEMNKIKEKIFLGLGNSQQAAKQKAEINRFIKEDYDVVLGMIKEREENEASGYGTPSYYPESLITELLSKKKPHNIHKSLIQLARRGIDKKTGHYRTAIATTNFDLLLEDAAKELGTELESYSLGEIPTPEHPDHGDFSGIFHIHGKLNGENPKRINKLILTDCDFGEWYLRKKIIPDFIYDVARNYSWVLVGYRANDPPMRYLLNAIANDKHRYKDIEPRYVFLASNVASAEDIADWESRDITPIVYQLNIKSKQQHDVLINTLKRWADLSPANSGNIIDQEIKRIMTRPLKNVTKSDKDIIEYFVLNEKKQHLTALDGIEIDLTWLDIIQGIQENGSVTDNENVQ